MPRVVELGGDPDLLTRNARVLDSLTNLVLVAVGQSSVDVAVSSEERGLDSLADLIGLALPCTQTNLGNFGALIEKSVLVRLVSCSCRLTVLRVKVCLVWSREPMFAVLLLSVYWKIITFQ